MPGKYSLMVLKNNNARVSFNKFLTGLLCRNFPAVKLLCKKMVT